MIFFYNFPLFEQCRNVREQELNLVINNNTIEVSTLVSGGVLVGVGFIAPKMI